MNEQTEAQKAWDALPAEAKTELFKGAVEPGRCYTGEELALQKLIGTKGGKSLNANEWKGYPRA